VTPVVLLLEPTDPGVPLWWQIGGPVILAVIAAAAAWYTARVTLRASREANRQSEAQQLVARDAAVDARHDKALAACWERMDKLATTNEELRLNAVAADELHRRLRRAVIDAGLDPDAMIRT
jgi:hypothetical protein